MLPSSVISKLQARFADRAPLVSIEAKSTAVFVNPNREVGDIVVDCDENEATVYIGEFTHVHFTDCDESVPADERERQITEQVASFLDDLFSEKVEFWKTSYGGTCQGRGAGPSDAAVFVWSGRVMGGHAPSES